MNQSQNKNKYTSSYARFVLSNRWIIIVLLTVCTVVSAMFVPQLNLRNDPDSLLPQNNPYIATNLYAKQTFGMGNIMVWGMEVKDGDIYQPWFINMLRDLHQDTVALKFSRPENFIALTAQQAKYMGMDETGSLEFNRLIPVSGISENNEIAAEELAYLRDGIESNPLLEALLVYYENSDGHRCDVLNREGKLTTELHRKLHRECTAKATFIVGSYEDELKDASQPWIHEHRALMQQYEKEYGDRVHFTYSGEPYFLASMILEITEKSWLFGLSILIVLLVLWYEFRNWRGAVFPLIGVAMTIILTLGLMGFTRFSLTTMMVLTPMLILAVGIGHSVQITRRFLQEAHLSGNVFKAAELSIAKTMIPATLSIITDIAGFFTLSFVDISFYKAYAYFGMFGMATLILTTTTLIPLLMTIFPPSDLKHDDSRVWEQRFGIRTGKFLTGKLKWIPVVLVLGIVTVSAKYTGIAEGISAMMSDERTDTEVARIQDEFDIMPRVEKGINYPRAAYKDSYYLGGLLKGDRNVRAISDLEELGMIMPGVITVNIVVRAINPAKPYCGGDAYSETGERLTGAEICYDQEEDPVQGIMNRADVLSALSDFEDWMRSHENVGFSISYVQFVKSINMLFATPVGEKAMDHLELYAIPTLAHMQKHWYAYEDKTDPEYVPDPDASVQLFNGLIEANTGAGELDSFINTATWDEGVIIGFIRSLDIIKAHKTMQDIQSYIYVHKNDPGMRLLTFGITADALNKENSSNKITNPELIKKAPIGGFLGITEATRDVAMQEWLKSPLTTALAIFIISALIFKSVSVAIVLMSLLFITLMSQYGLGGYMTSVGEWSANLAFHVQVALSIAMGLGVDYSIYMISRLREEMQETGENWQRALQNTLTATGSGVLISVIVLIGSFIPLMATELANTWSVSLYIAQALILDVITALLFLPLLVFWLKPDFVFQKKN